MSILVTGARGFVGARIMEALPGAVAAPSLREFTQDSIQRLMDQVQPEAIIHTAAIADMDACEKDPEGSYRANVVLSAAIARAAKNIPMAFYSTDQVYAALPDDAPFREDQVKSNSTYGRHKIEMEQRVLDIAPHAVMLRASWMYDMPLYRIKDRVNFLSIMLDGAAKGRTVYFSRYVMHGITWVRNVAENTKAALSLPGGCYNFGSGADCTMYELALLMKEKMGLQMNLLPGEDRGNLWMDQEKLNRAGIYFPDHSQALMDCLQAYGMI